MSALLIYAALGTAVKNSPRAPAGTTWITVNGFRRPLVGKSLLSYAEFCGWERIPLGTRVYFQDAFGEGELTDQYPLIVTPDVRLTYSTVEVEDEDVAVGAA